MNALARADKSASDQLTGPDAKPVQLESKTLATPAGAVELQSLLGKHFRDNGDDAVAVPAAALPPASNWTSRLVKSAVGLALVVAAGWMPAQRLFQISSVEAVVNARLVTVRAPIDGIVRLDTRHTGLGETIDLGDPLVTVTNPRADRSRLEAAGDELSNAQQERQALSLKLLNLKGIRESLRTQLAAFHSNRLLQLDAQNTEADAGIQASVAELARADAIRSRQARLSQSGSVAQSRIDDAERDSRVAVAAVAAARARRAVLVVERDALNAGTYLGDAYNDQPRSAQRLDEVEQAIAGLDADMVRLATRMNRAEDAISDEEQSLAMNVQARLMAPVDGTVWEVLTAPGEQVTAGQPLFSLLNCSDAIVTATVSEAVYNTLSVGMPATFTYRQGGAALAGKVVQLSGVASASSHFAIMPSALTKESYRVAISVSKLASDGSCPVGRTGRVVFEPAAS